MSRHDPRVTLVQMAEFASQAQGLVRGQTFEAFVGSPVHTLALERLMECLGEGVKRLPQELRDRNPEVNWKGVAGMRDWLVHAYDGVDHRILWTAVLEDIPGLLDAVARMSTALERESAKQEGLS
jgi:uncharacterized protein with HEPN domain